MKARSHLTSDCFSRFAVRLLRRSSGCACGLLGLLLLGSPGWGQETDDAAPAGSESTPMGEGGLRGRVLNADTGRYVSRALVQITGTSQQALTNDFGEYVFYDIPAGIVELRVAFAGRDPITKMVEVPAGREGREDFIFRRDYVAAPTEEGDEDVIDLGEFIVKANDYQTAAEIATQQERFAPTLRNVVDTDAFGLVPDGNVGEFVKFMPGVQVDYGGTYSSGADASSISVRGFSADQTAVTIDGIPVSSSVPGSLSRTVGLDTMSINNAARIEVIKVPTPDQPSASIGGSVNLISKSAFEYPKPSLRFRIFTTINSENFDDFWKKTPGPVNEDTYKVLPGVELTYAWPINEKLGLTLTLAQSNTFNAGLKQKSSYVFDGTAVGPFRELDGTVIGSLDMPVYADVAHPFLDNLGVTDSPRSSTRNSASLKVDWRPFDGHLFTVNYQYSTFTSKEAARRFEMNAGARNGVLSFGPDHIFSDLGNGKSEVNVTALDRDGDSNSMYLKWSYIKGPWNVKAHVSYAVSNGTLNSTDNGHFAGAALNMGGIELSRYSDIVDGLPGTIEYYGLAEGQELPYTAADPERVALADPAVIQGLVDTGVLVSLDPTKLTSYSLSGYDPEDPSASSLEVEGGQSLSRNTITTYKFDLRRDIDFLPFKFMNLALKAGVYREERKDEKWGLGIGHKYVYTGTVPLTIENYMDTKYVGVDPGFGFEPREWPDVYKIYDFFEENPTAFDDTSDAPRGEDLDQISVAAENWNSFVNQQKSVTETSDAFYVQFEADFFNNRLSVVGGVRQETTERVGRAPFKDGDWKFLRVEEDSDGDGNRDPLVLQVVDFSGESDYNDFPVYDYRPDGAFEFFFNSAFPLFLDPLGSGMNVTLAEALDRSNAVYNNAPSADPIPYDPANPIAETSLAAAQLKLKANRRVDARSRGRASPILSTSFDITDKLVFRASWSQTYAKPPLEGASGILSTFDISETAPGDSGTIRIPNPELRPWSSDNWDFSLSYYTDTGGKLTFSYYMKTIEDGHVSFVYDLADRGLVGTPGEAQDLLDSLNVPYESRFYDDGWRVIQTINSGAGGKTSGYEIEISQGFEFLGDWGRNFRLYASMSDQTTDTDTIVSATGGESSPSVPFAVNVSKLALNAGLQFSYKRLSLRANATWRDEKLSRTSSSWLYFDPTVADRDETDDDDPLLDRSDRVPVFYFSPAELRIDVNFSYQITKRYSLSVSGRNITNSASEDFLRGPYLPEYANVFQRDQFGVQWTIGLSGQF